MRFPSRSWFHGTWGGLWLGLGLGLGLDLDMIRQVLLRFGLSWLGWLGLACAFYNISVTCFVTLALFAFLGAS